MARAEEGTTTVEEKQQQQNMRLMVEIEKGEKQSLKREQRSLRLVTINETKESRQKKVDPQHNPIVSISLEEE